MALNGNLSTMSVTELLEWVAANRKTGILRVERNKACKKVHFREGHVVGCSSDEPPALLGQFLLSRGTINEEQLRQALYRQEATGESLGKILTDMRAMTKDELGESLNAKAEDTIHGLFDWDEAAFQFDDQPEEDPYVFEVDLKVQDILERGKERAAEMKRFREVFGEEGMVLERTGKAAPPEVQKSRMGNRILESINGQRTLAEIVLHARASEYLVTKFLLELHRLGAVKVKEVRQVRREAEEASRALQQEEEASQALQQEEVLMVAAGGSAEAVTSAPPGAAPDADLVSEIEAALRFMDRKEHDAALDVLNDSYRANPGDPTIRKLIDKAESAVVQAQQGELSPKKIPRLLCPPESLSSENLSPEASFLPSLIDGKNDIQAILWLAPLRTVDVMRALKHMLDKGLIGLQDPE